MLLHVHIFFVPTNVVVTQDDGMISFFLKEFIKPLPANILGFLYVALLLIQSIRLEYLMSELKMFHKDGFTTALAYLLLSGLYPVWYHITPALVANSFIIWIFIQLSKLYNNPSPKTLLFNTGLIVGATVLCYHPAAIILVVVLFSVALIRPFHLSEYFVLLMGCVMPFYLIISLLFLNDQMVLLKSFIPSIKFLLPVITTDLFFWISTALIALMVLAGLFVWSPQNNRMVIQIRKSWNVMLLMLLIILIVPLFISHAGMVSAVLIMVPFAAFISNVFLYPKRLWFPNLLFFLVLALVCYYNWQLLKLPLKL